nr:hypothetical protein [Tanacetum cinerariifolium]
MGRVGKGFFGVDTPLFEGMLVPPQAANDVADVAADDVANVVVDDVANDVDERKLLLSLWMLMLRGGKKSLKHRSITAAATTITVAPNTAATITAAPSAARKRKGVVIRDPEETATPSTIVHSEPKSKDKGKGIMRRRRAVRRRGKQGTKKKSESFEQQAAKKQKLDKEVQELKKHLQLVLNDEDDVYTESTPLALKVLVVDYQIHTENNKPYYKIIRADGTHQLFISFLSLLRNFNREDLEMLWQIVQERFASLKLKNFSDDFLLTTLKGMFKKPEVKAHIWKNQRGIHGLAKVKSWKLLESCGVHIITFTTTEMILLVERSFRVDAIEDFKEYTLRNYYCWLKTYYCWYMLKLLDNAADSRLRLLEQSAAVDDKIKK